MKHIKLFEQFINEAAASTHTIFDFIDFDYPEEPAFIITGYEDSNPTRLKMKLKKALTKQTDFEIGDASGDYIINIKVDKKGNLISYTNTEDDDLDDTPFEWLEENTINETSGAWDKLNKKAEDVYGEFGFATLDVDDMSKCIDMKKADKLADKMFGEFGFTSLSEEEMKSLINKNPSLVIESSVNEDLQDDALALIKTDKKLQSAIKKATQSASERDWNQVWKRYDELGIDTNTEDFEGFDIEVVDAFDKL